MKDFYLILFHISIVFSVITASNSFEVLGAVTSTETTIHSSAVLPPPPPAAPTVSLGVSPTGTVCAATALNFTATGSPTTGTNTYEFLVNGSVVQGPGISNTYSSSSLTNGQQVTTRLTNKPTFDGVINEALWDTPLSTSAGGAAPGFGAGHEVNALYSFGTANDFYLAVAGNVQNGNRILVFIDSKSGGYADGNFGRAGAPQGVDDFNSSTTFDSGFLPDYCLTMGTNAGGSNYFWDLYTLSGTFGSGGGPNTYLGDNSAAAFGGVDLKASPLNSSQTRGFEAGLPKSLIGYTGGTIKVMVMYASDAGFLSNQFLTPAGSGEGNYGSGAVTFGAAAPGPIVVSSTALSTVNTATSTPIIASVSLLPTITVSSNSPTCEGSTLSLLATGGSTYSWEGPSGFISAVQNPSIISVTPAATGTYTVTVTNSAGCSTVGTTAVTINATPTANAGSPQTVCQGGTITLAGSRGGSATTSTWSASSGAFSDATSLTSTYTPSITSGTVTLTLTTNDPDGAGPCSAAVSTVVITVGQAPVVNAGAPQSVCAGQSITLNGSTTGVPATPVTWSAPSGTFSNVNLLTSTYTPSITSGTVTLTLTTSDPDGAGPCVAATSTVLITVMDSPTVAAGSNTPVCGGNPLSLTSSGGILYSWSGPSGFSSTSQNPSISAVTAANAGDYTVTVTNSNACSATRSTTVVINGAFSASASSNSPVNQGNTINLSTPTSGSSYAWSGPNAFTSSAQNPTVTATPEASGVYTVVVTNASGCTAMATTLVTVNLSQTTVTICSGTDVTLTATISGGSGTCGITWETSPNGTTGWTVIPGQTGTTYTTPALNNFTLLQTAVYYRATYTCTGTGCGSSISNTQQILINPEPVGTPLTPVACSDVAVGVGATLAVPLATTYNITSIVDNGLTASAGSPATGNGLAADVLADDAWTNTTGSPVNVIYTIVPVSGASPNNCLGDPFTVTVTVTPEPVGVATPATQTVCSDVAITTIALTTSNSLTGTTFAWTRDNTANITVLANSGSGDISGTPNNVTGTTQTTVYTITPTSSIGCVGNDFTASVTVTPEPVGVATPATQTVCSDVAITTIALTTSNSLTGTTFAWTRDNTANITVLANSGSGDISGTPNNVTGTTQTTVYTITPTSSIGCVGNDFTASVTVTPEPVGVATPATQTVCSDVAITTIALTTSNSLTGTTFAWTRDNTANITVLANSGSGDISGTPNNVTGTTQTTVYTITPTSSIGCVGNDFTASVTVTPEPVGVATPATQTVCSDVAITTIALTTSNSLTGTTFAWTRDNTANITVLANSGSGDISGTPNNVTGTTQTTVYTITPTSSIGCVGNDFTASVTVTPEPVGVATPATQTVCSDVAITTIALTTSNSLTGTTFAWTRDNTANITVLANSGSGDISGTPNNVTGTTQTTVYTITPTSSIGCVGNDFTASVTVTPEPVGVATPATQTVCSDVAITTIALTTSNSLTGTTFAWTRDNTANITVLANSGSGDISGTPNNVTGTTQTTVYTITPTSSIGCVGNDFTASVTVTPEPVGVATPATQTVCSDVAITTISLTTSNSLTGTTFAWTRDNTANITVLANSGSGDISGTPNNVTGTTQTTVYTITPTSSIGCVGNDFTASVTVTPEPVGVATPATQTVCSDVAITTISLTTSNSLTGTTFAWTRDNTANITVLANSGSGDISGTPNNVTGTTQTTVYTITPTSSIGCVGNDFTASVTVTPEPVGVATPATQTVCSDVAITTIALTTSNSLTGTTFAWTRDNTANITVLANSGSGDISGTPNNVTGTTQTTVYTITPTSSIGCVGNDFTASVTVTPEPVGVATPATQTVCSDVAITTIALTTSNSLTGTTFAWTRDNTANITVLANSGSGDISGTPNNVTGATQTTVYTITPTSSIGCVGNDFTASVTVTPEPVGVATPATQTVCSDVAITTIALTTSNSLTGTTFAWTRDNTANITVLANSGSGDISGTPNNVTGTTQTTVYTITPTSSIGCVGNDFTASVTVTPEPVGVATPATQTVCSDVAITTIALTTSNSLTGTTFAWTRDNTANITVLANSGSGDISGTPNNVTGTTQTTVYTITPTSSIGCVGNDFTASVTVTPEPVGVATPATQTVCSDVAITTIALTTSNSLTGTTFAWTRDNTANITVLANSGSGDISGTPNNVTGATQTTVYTITPTSSIGCVGNDFTASVTVTPEPVGVATPATQTVCSDVAITTIALTTSNSLTGTTFAWTRDNTANITVLANSGSGDISGTPNNVTGTTQTTVYTITPTSSIGCVGNDFTASVTVTPEPVGVATPATQTVCSDVAITTIALTTSNSLTGTTFAWTRDNTANITVLANSGSGDISGTPNNVTGTTQTTVYTITPTSSIGCVGNDFTASVTVTPEPVGVATPATQTVCSDVAITTIALTTSNSLTGTTFAWTRDNTTNITVLANSGSGDISGTPNNVTGTTQTTVYTITPTSSIGCVGNDFTASVTVTPEPVGVATPATQTVCSDVAITTIALTTSNSLTGTTFAWTRDNTANITVLANSGSGDISGTPNNVTGTTQTTVYTITPTSSIGCVGNDFTASVTVTPEPVGVATPATQTVCSDVAITTIALTTSNSLTGTTFAWTRDNTANITVLANSGSGDISGTPNNVTGTTQTTVYTITPTSSIGCVGNDFTASVTVTPEPVGVATPATQTVCSDVAITTIALTTSNSLTGTTFAWTRDNTANITVLANSGSGDISGTPNNVTGATQTTVYTITPTSSIGCVGNDFTASVTVTPEPVGVATPATQTVCSDVAITTIALTTSNSLTGTTFAWTRDNTTNITALANSGTTDISGTPNNVTGTTQTTVYTITPTSSIGCVGNDFTASVTVTPEPVGVATPATQTVCSDVAITTIALTTSNSLTGTTFAWTRDNTTNITVLANSGSGDISGTPNNVTGTTQTTVYTITPTSSIGCVGNDFTASVTVTPEPVGVATPATQTVCSDVAITTIALTTSNSLTGTTFAWTRDNTANITVLANSGSGDISGTPNNVTGTTQTTVYTITPTSSIGCVGNDFTASVTVTPEPVGVATPATQTVCSDVAITTIALTTSNSLTGTTFAWTRDNTANITVLANSGSGDISGTPNNVTGATQTTVYTITPTSSIGCVGNDFTASVTVTPEPVGVATPATQTVCSDVAITTIALTTSNSLTGTTFAWTRDNTANITVLANSGSGDISGTPNNVTGATQTTVYTITPTSSIGCVGNDFTASVTVTPEPVGVATPATQTVCSDVAITTIALTTSNSLTGTTFAWTRDNTTNITALANSGTTDISGTPNNVTTITQTTVYTITPTSSIGCVGNDFTASVTVTPEPVGVATPATQTVCSDVAITTIALTTSNSLTGTTFAWTRDNTANITVLANSGSGDISGTPNNVTGTTQTTVYTITPTSSIGCVGNDFTASVTVTPEPVGVATPATQTVCSDVAITTIALTTSNSLTGTTFAWTRDNTANITVLANSGSGDISGTPNNVTGATQTTVYTITPTSSIGCVGNDFTASVTVTPEPVGVATPATQTVCSDVAITTIALTTSNSLTGTTFAWTRDNTTNITALANSGTTDISGTPNNVTGTTQTTVYTITPTSSIGCVGNDFTASVTVTPEPVGVATPATQTVCSDVAITTIALTTSNSLTGTTFAWTRDNTANITVLANSGSGDISGTPNNVTGTTQTTVYTITPTSSIGCVGNDFTASVTVTPEPVGVATPATQTVCSDVAITTIALTTSNSLTGTTFAWTRDNTTNITVLANSGSGDISGTPNNVTGTTQTTVYTITPTSSIGCVGNDFTASVTVTPEPVGVATPATQTVCSDVAITTIALTTSNSLTGTTFAWTRDNTANITVLANSGSGDISGTPNNVTGTTQTTVYTITPTSSIGCVGNDFTASVTVTPEPVGVATPATQTVCSDVAITTIALTTSNSLTGTTFAWTRDNTANITVLANSGSGDISGTPNNVTGTTQTTVYTITPTSSIGCVGNDFTASVTVTPEPVGVATPATQTVCSDVAITTIALTTSNSLTGTTFAWTRDNTANITVLANSGSGDISGTPNNVTGATQTTVYTITPTSSIGCVGNDFTASVTVTPEPVGVATPATQTVCSDVAITTIALTTSNSLTGTTFAWTRDNTANITVLANSGSGDISGTPNNVTGTTQTTVYTITPTSSIGCVGNDFTASVTVTPEPVGVATPATQTVCSDVAITTIALTTSNSLTGTTFAWTRDNTANITVLANSGSGDISGTPNNVTGTTQTTVYTITPTSSIGCVGNDFTASVTVTPEPVGVATPATQTVCSDVAITTIALTTSNSLTGTTFAWTRDNTANITVLANSGSGDISGTPNNVTGATQTTVYTITPTSSIGCVGNDFTASVTVTPEPVGVATPATQTVCSDVAITTIALTTSNSLTGTTFAWTRDNTANITVLANSGSGDISGTPNNVTGTTQTTVYTITPTSSIGCVGNDFTASVTVTPEPVGVATPATQTVCSDVAITTISLTTSNSLTGTTFAWTRDNTANITVLANSGSGDISGTPNNVTGTTQTTVYTITPTSSIGCVGNDFTASVTVTPEPVGSDPSVAPICSGTALNVGLQSTISNLPTGVTFSWSATDNADVTGETTTTSTATSITDNLVNISGTSQTVIYTVTPTSSLGCAGNPYTITVTVNPAPIFDVIANAAYCNNDAATAINFNTNVSGATITWTSTVDVGFGTSGNGNIPAYTATNTGTTPVTTTVTVTATGSGCVTTTTFTVTVNPTPTVNTVSTPETCNELNNGTASITPIVGTAPFNYQWNNGDVTANITALSAGTYTATVTDANGCSTITSTTVTQPAPLTATASGVNETCNQLDNATVSVVAAGGTTAYNYVWNSGQTTASASGVSAGTYTVTVTDANGCTVSTSTIVTQPDALTATLESTVNVSCSTITPDGAINIATTGGTTAYTYAWTGTAATTEDLTGLAAGNYTLTVTDANGCSTVVGPITITLNPDPTITVGNSTTICTGGVANFTANVANGVGTCGVQWEQLIGATWTPISGANATTYTTVPLTATTDYRAVYSCSTGCTVTSNPVTATVTADPAISIASNATVCTGGTSVLTATPSGGTDSCIIQWQSSIDNSNWTNIPGANAATYTTPTLTTTTYYRALYTCNGNGCDGATSGSVTITVTATPVIIINATPNGN